MGNSGPEEVAQKLLLQRRYQVRNDSNQGLLPTEAHLSADDWMALAQTVEELRLLYDTSALIVHLVAETSGHQGLRELVEAKSLEVSLASFFDVQLRLWLSIPFPEEEAGLVLCTLSDVLAAKGEVVSDWNVTIEEESPDFSPFKPRVQQLLDSVESLPTDSLVEETRSAYGSSLSEWLMAIEDYIAGDYDSGNFHLARSSSLGKTANELFSDAWDEYVVISCTLIQQQLS